MRLKALLKRSVKNCMRMNHVYGTVLRAYLLTPSVYDENIINPAKSNYIVFQPSSCLKLAEEDHIRNFRK